MQPNEGKMKQLEMEDPAGSKAREKIPYPKSVFFIMATELSERFSYYGMRAVLTIYMRNVLSFSENLATSYYHVFLMLCYGLPIVWGVISDSWLGKFKTILYVSILFALGNVILTLSSIPPLHLPTTGLFFTGLILMAVGTAGMKPCVAPLGGEQFVLPEQSRSLEHFFSVFFFVVTVGNMISTVVTPIFRRDISCFGQDNCFSLAFGVPSITMILAIVIFVSGRPLYKLNKPSGNMLVKVTKCVAHAVTNRKRKSRSDGRSKHWLDSASDSYDEGTISDTKRLFRILPYFLPVPMFFALYEQLGSRWTLQATRMNGRIGNFSIKPDQMQVSNAILMFVSLPFFNWVVYPLLGKAGIRLRTLQRMVIGGLLAAASFAVAGFVSMKIDPTVNVKPSEGHSILTFANVLPCHTIIQVNSSTSSAQTYTVDPESFLQVAQMRYLKNSTFSAEILYKNCTCTISKRPFQGMWNGTLEIVPGEYQTVTILPTRNHSLALTVLPLRDEFKKSKDGNAKIRFVLKKDSALTISDTHLNLTGDEGEFMVKSSNDRSSFYSKFSLHRDESVFYSEVEEVNEGSYDVIYATKNSSAILKSNVDLKNGGSYNFITFPSPANITEMRSQVVEITPPNSIHILWLLPQYTLMAWGEITFIVSGMEFSYTEAPASMKSVVQAIWHLMNAFGNIIVIISAQNHGHRSQTMEFFIFAGLMLVDSIIYWLMSRRYKYVSVDEKAVVMH